MKMSFLQALVLVASAALTAPAASGCDGTDLIDAMAPEARAELFRRAEAVPYPRGNLWRAERAGSVIDVVGTMHLADPRHDSLLDTARPLVEAADLILLEVTSDEMARLGDAMARDPGIAFVLDGPTLVDVLEPGEWQALSAAMAARGIPGIVASRMRPFMVATTLAMPDCLLPDLAAAANGLDRMIESEALRLGRPIDGLEGYEALLDLFDRTDPDVILDMLRATLVQSHMAADHFATMANAYFAGEHRLVWEFSRSLALDPSLAGFDPDRLLAGLDAIHDLALVERNHAWMARLLPLAEGRRLVVAVGAGHLAGEDGILRLLERAGYTLRQP